MTNDVAKMMQDALNGAASSGVYFFCRDDESTVASIGLKKGLLVKGVALVSMLKLKISSQQLLQFRLGMQMLQPYQRGGISEPDYEKNFDAVEKQNLFLRILVDALNDPAGYTSEADTNFTLKEETGDKGRLRDIVEPIEFKKIPDDIPVFELGLNDGAGKYQRFMTISCPPEYRERFLRAIVDAVYTYEARIRPAQPKDNPSGLPPPSRDPA